MARPQFVIKRGDDLPIIEHELRDPNGRTPNITGATVQFKYRVSTKALPVVVRSAIVVDGAAARVRYVWQSSDTTTAGHYDAEWRVIFPDGKKLSFPNDQFMDLWIPEDLS